MDVKPTQHIEITHPQHVNSKLAFHKVASFHQYYSTHTLQTYHHKVVVIQESKLTPKSKNPCIQNYTTVRKDRPHGQSGRLLIFSIDPRISTYSWWNCQATQNRLQIEINYYPDNLLFISVGFLPRVSSQHNTYISQLILPMTTKSL